MKVGVFADIHWAIGRVYRDIAKYIPEYEFKYISWASWTLEELYNVYHWCDILITNVCEVNMLPNHVNPSKILFISHGFEEHKDRILNPDYNYGITSESIRTLITSNNKIWLMPNGVDPAQFDYSPKKRTINTIGWCGHPGIWYKQAHWTQIITEYTNTKLSITSMVPCEDDFSKWQKLSYDEIKKWYSTIDLLLVTSIPEEKYETGPLSAFEAIASGVPVIGTPVGNFKNVPGPKFTTIEEAVELIHKLKENPEYVKALATEQYDYVMKHFTYESFANKWKEALESIFTKNKSNYIMKVCIFTDSCWALGVVARDLKASLTDYEVDIIDWSGHSQEGIQQIYNTYDVIIVNIAGKWLFNHLPDKRKILFRTDGFEEFNNSGSLEIENTYSAVSEPLMKLFPEGSKVFWTPAGGNPALYTHKERDGVLNKVGWCGAPRVWFKQSHWAIEIAKQAELPFNITSSVPCEHNVQIWEPLTHEQVREWYSTIDLLLITSIPNGISETGPLSAFEAILSGVPVIGTPTGNFAKIPGPKFSSIEEGVNILTYLKYNPDHVKQIAKEQYEYVMNHFTYESFAHKWKEAIEYVHNLSKDSKN